MTKEIENKRAELKPGVSLCMIAKDEAHCLERCLQSAAPWVDEIILLDTGSQDRTREIARDLGARVFSRPWQHDFALARNQSLEHAGREWVFFMDADEELSPDGAAHIRKAAERQGYELGLVDILHLSPDGGHTLQISPRLLSRAAGVHFEGCIHERVVGARGRPLRLPIRIIHHGYLDQEAMACKADRNLSLVRAWMAREPENPEAAIYLAQSLMVFPDRGEETLRAAAKALALVRKAGRPDRLLPRAYHPLFMALTRLGRHAELMDRAGECLELLPDYPDPLYSLTWAGLRLGRLEEVCRAGRRFAEVQGAWARRPLEYPYPHNLSLNLGARVMKRWALAAARLGRPAEVREALSLLWQMPDPRQPAKELAAELRALGTAAPQGAALALGAV